MVTAFHGHFLMVLGPLKLGKWVEDGQEVLNFALIFVSYGPEIALAAYLKVPEAP